MLKYVKVIVLYYKNYIHLSHQKQTNKYLKTIKNKLI